MKDITKITLKGLNVIKYFLYFSAFLIFTNCNILKGDYYKTETYEIKREKSKYWTKLTQLNIIAYEYENKSKLIPVFSITINDIIINSAHMNSIPNALIHLIPNKYDVEISFIGKETINIKNLLVKKGDSIVIKSFMKEDVTPLY